MTPDVTSEEQATGERSSWYVALAQLPGLPVKLRLEVMAIVSAAIRQMPVSSRRDHFWAGGARSAAFVGEDSDALEDQMPDVALEVATQRDSVLVGHVGV